MKKKLEVDDEDAAASHKPVFYSSPSIIILLFPLHKLSVGFLICKLKWPIYAHQSLHRSKHTFRTWSPPCKLPFIALHCKFFFYCLATFPFVISSTFCLKAQILWVFLPDHIQLLAHLIKCIGYAFVSIPGRNNNNNLFLFDKVIFMRV